MDVDGMVRRLRGAVGSALVWGLGWSGFGLVAFAVLRLAGVVPASASWADGLFVSVRMGMVGVVAGAAFSSVVGIVYRGRRLSDIGWVRFGIGGGVVAGLFVPLFFQAMNLLSGDGMVPMALVLDDASLAAVFGAAAAAGMLRLAQHAEQALPVEGRGRSHLLGSGDGAASGRPRDARSRSRSAPR